MIICTRRYWLVYESVCFVTLNYHVMLCLYFLDGIWGELGGFKWLISIILYKIFLTTINDLCFLLQDEFLDVIYWLRQIIAVILGVIWGVAPLKGFLGIAMWVFLLMHLKTFVFYVSLCYLFVLLSNHRCGLVIIKFTLNIFFVGSCTRTVRSLILLSQELNSSSCLFSDSVLSTPVSCMYTSAVFNRLMKKIMVEHGNSPKRASWHLLLCFWWGCLYLRNF